MNENLNKPITIVRAEFISNLIKLINTSCLPPFIIEPILRDVHMEIREAANNQYRIDVENYNKNIQALMNKDSQSMPCDGDDL